MALSNRFLSPRWHRQEPRSFNLALCEVCSLYFTTNLTSSSSFTFGIVQASLTLRSLHHKLPSVLDVDALGQLVTLVLCHVVTLTHSTAHNIEKSIICSNVLLNRCSNITRIIFKGKDFPGKDFLEFFYLRRLHIKSGRATQKGESTRSQTFTRESPPDYYYFKRGITEHILCQNANTLWNIEEMQFLTTLKCVAVNHF